jgi:hypothetical protein
MSVGRQLLAIKAAYILYAWRLQTNGNPAGLMTLSAKKLDKVHDLIAPSICAMISKIYISHSEKDEPLALLLSKALWRIGLESYSAIYNLSPGISRAELVSFGIQNSECLIALLTKNGSVSCTVCQEVGFAKGCDILIIPLLEDGAKLPILIEQSYPIAFSKSNFEDGIGKVIKNIRDLNRLDWLKIICPKCGEEMTQYLTPPEEVEEAISKGAFLETVCSYCQNKLSLDPRTFEPIP